MSEQDGMGTGDGKVVVHHRDGSQDRLDIPQPGVATPPVGQLDADEELCCGDRGHHHVILVCD